MKKKLVKLLSVMLALMMLFVSMTACGKKKEETVGSQTGGSTQQVSTTGASSSWVSNNPITLKFLCYSRTDFQFSNDMPVFKELEKRTNVKLDWQLLPPTEALQKLNLIMASNELPDMISFGDGPTLNKYGMQGAFIALDELIDKNAPNIKKAMTNPPFPIPNLKAEMKASDGKIYALPFLTETVTGEIFCIRQDWLDKLGLKAPDTTDDLYNVLKAFKERDPNGNGKPDEIPFSYPGTGPLTIMMNAFGAHENFYVAKDGTIKFGPIEDNYKEGLAFINKLIKDELVDKEFLSMNRQQFDTKVSNNIIGAFYAWPFSGLAACNTNIKKVDPKAQYVSFLPVKGPHGDRFKERPQNSVLPRTVITKANKYPKETIKYLDYLYSDDGVRLMNWGIEGVHYKLVNGKLQFTDLILKNPEGKDVATARALAGMQMALPTIATLEPEKAAVADPEVAKAWQKYADAKVVWPVFPNLPLTDEQRSRVANKVTEINTYLNENIVKFMMGQTPLDEFSKFVDQIKKMGIDEVLKIYNEAYKKYSEFNK